jgi:hypothetical protein
MTTEAIKNNLQLAEKKLAFLKAKQLTGGLSFDQEFAIQQDLTEVEAEIATLRQQLANAYGLHTESGQTILLEKIRQLDLDAEEFGRINLVNCNRETPTNHFWDDFYDRFDKAIPFQFYFILACPNQQPNSFSERMVEEIIEEELDREETAILCRRQKNTNRLVFEDLPLGRRLDRSQNEFKKHFADRFKLEDKTLEAYLQTGLPRINYKFVATIFTLDANKWRDFVKDYFDWIIAQFKDTQKEVPTFLFFFVIQMKEAHQTNLPPEFQKIKTSLETIKAAQPEYVTFLNNLFPVERDLVEAWVSESVRERNNAKIKNVVDALVAGLKPEAKAQYLADKTLNMSEIELFQELVYKAVNE